VSFSLALYIFCLEPEQIKLDEVTPLVEEVLSLLVSLKSKITARNGSKFSKEWPVSLQKGRQLSFM
jgi:hypothetical protein